MGEGEVIALVKDGDILHTDHPAASHARSTHFYFGAGEVLVLDFVGACAWFVREL